MSTGRYYAETEEQRARRLSDEVATLKRARAVADSMLSSVIPSEAAMAATEARRQTGTTYVKAALAIARRRLGESVAWDDVCVLLEAWEATLD